MKKNIFFLSVLLMVFAACEKNVTINIPEKPPRLVINAWLDEEQSISVSIGKSRHILKPLDRGVSQQENYTVKTAVPVIYENNIPIDTLIYHSDYTYKSLRNTKIRLGHIYKLKVTAPGFTEAEAETIVPTKSEIAEVKRVKNAKTTSSGQEQDEVTIKLNDPAEKNFYLIQIFPAQYSSSYPAYPVYCVNTTDKDIESSNNGDPLTTEYCYDGGRLIVRDDNFNGRQKQLRFYVDSWELVDRPNGGQVNKPYVKVHRITEEYFKFIKSYDIYYNSDGNPFAEPVNVFSNVKNGYGIFSAHTIAVDTLR